MRRAVPLWWLSLQRRRRMLGWLALALLAFEVLIAVIAASVPVPAMLGSADVPDAFQAFSGSSGEVPLASLPGLVGAGLVHPFWIALHLAAIASLSAGVLAADVEAGTIELLAVRPVSRIRLLAERGAAVVTGSLLLHVAATTGLLAGRLLDDTLREAVGVAGVLAAGVQGLALTLAVAGPAILVSAAGHRRAQPIAAAVIVGVGGFVANFLALAYEPLAWLRWVTPFARYRPADAIARGAPDWLGAGILSAVFVVSVALAVVAVRRRDLAPR